MWRKFPNFYNNSVTSPLLEALYNQEQTLTEDVQSLTEQFFLESATSGLIFWEKMLGIPENSNNVQLRRENIKAKMRSRGTSSISVIKNICESYSNGEVEIEVDHANHHFIIYFVGSLGTPANFEEMDKTINDIKPCHLTHEYVYYYNTHSNLSKHTHEELSHYTHEEIRTSKELK